MFEHLRQSWRGILDGTLAPDERREVLARMKETLVQARVGIGEMRDGLGAVRKRLEYERTELATCIRRKELALGIGDAETVSVAERFERYHQERVTVLERKCGAQEAELVLAEREVDEMTVELKHAASGARPPGANPSSAFGAPSPGASQASGGSRTSGTGAGSAAAEMDAELRLAALKRRMGK
jgi:hypothetical protein